MLSIGSMKRLPLLLLSTGFFMLGDSSSADLELVGRVPIKGGGSSQVYFSPSGDRAIVQWTRPYTSGSPWLIDLSSENVTAVELAGQHAVWSRTQPEVAVVVDGIPDRISASYFNIDPALLGIENAGISLIDENGSILTPAWPSAGQPWPNERVRKIAAVDGKTEHVLLESGTPRGVVAMLDPLLKRILLREGQNTYLCDIAGPEISRTRLPNTNLTAYTLVPGHSFLIAHVMEKSVLEGREPKWQKLYIADMQGELLKEFLHMEYPEVEYADVLVRSSPKLTLISDAESFYVYRILSP